MGKGGDGVPVACGVFALMCMSARVHRGEFTCWQCFMLLHNMWAGSSLSNCCHGEMEGVDSRFWDR